MQGFLLGLGNAPACLAFCLPILVPYFLAEGKDVWKNVSLLATFLLGRLLGYLMFGVLAWTANFLVERETALRELAFGLTYTVLAVLLIAYVFVGFKTPCAAKSAKARLADTLQRWPFLLPGLFGLLTGLNLCPPFLLGIVAAAETGTLWGSLWFFLTFFLGTTVFFIPLPFVGVLRRMQRLQLIGRLSAGVVGGYYLYRGLIMLYTGGKLL